jgi:hypothetical protein
LVKHSCLFAFLRKFASHRANEGRRQRCRSLTAAEPTACGSFQPSAVEAATLAESSVKVKVLERHD